MGIKIEISEFFYSLIINLILINVICDINLINCDLQKMKQQTVGLVESNSTQDENKINNNLNINATQLKQFVMDGLDMKNVPDMNLVRMLQVLIFNIDARLISIE